MSTFTITTRKIWSCHVTLSANFKNFYVSPNSVLNFGKIYKIWGKSAEERKRHRQKQNSGWKTPPPPPPVLIGLKIKEQYIICIS